MRARLSPLLEATGRLIRTPELFLTVQQGLGPNVTLARPISMSAGVDAVGRCDWNPASTIERGRVDHQVTKLPGFVERAHQRSSPVHAPLYRIDAQPDGVGRQRRLQVQSR